MEDDDGETTVPQSLVETQPMSGAEPARDPLRDTLHVLESHAGSAAEPLVWETPVARPGLGGSPRLVIAGAAISHTGRVRQGNEDAFMVWPEGNLALVADGMGGHVGGEVASSVAVESVRDWLAQRGLPESAGRARTAFVDAILRADARVQHLADQRDGLAGMGTTVVGAWFIDDQAVVVHVGDSRLYRLREGEMTQITGDHNLAGELRRRGILDTQEALAHPQRNVLTQALGGKQRVEPDATRFDLRAGDRLLLCSDGLTDMVGDDLLRAFLGRPGAPPLQARMLLEAALANGGKDNVTVVVAHVS